MSVMTYRRLWCDGVSGQPCGAWIGMAETPGETAAELRRVARADGWRHRRDGRNGRDLCPDCAEAGEGQ
ncbi:hypothetical protein [Streptantibioticus silvisoli]|uniref:Uncharacterized protein n=1 Tax=Streptantibioticus silvisoli TaxID=2705255 RepID=A0ABT6W4Y1_9ACTN|nr:hypothetical protein [Streptantibioticus silvisoli]MDI5965817.1 hypothetical protein [Streptantibioticus silvisoli]